jgi:hypothetical protein
MAQVSYFFWIRSMALPLFVRLVIAEPDMVRRCWGVTMGVGILFGWGFQLLDSMYMRNFLALEYLWLPGIGSTTRMTAVFMRAAIMISRAPTLPSDLKATWLVTNGPSVATISLFYGDSTHPTAKAPRSTKGGDFSLQQSPRLSSGREDNPTPSATPPAQFPRRLRLRIITSTWPSFLQHHTLWVIQPFKDNVRLPIPSPSAS